MVLGAFGMAISMLLVGVLLRTEGSPHYDADSHKVNFDFKGDKAPAGKAVLAFLYLYVASFAISWGTPAWVVPAEIFPLNARSRANSMCTATNWLVNFFFALYIPTALNNISWKLYIIFAGICVLAGIWVFVMQPETANRSLEEMDAMFEGKTKFPFLDKELTRVKPHRDPARERQLTEEGRMESIAVQHGSVEKEKDAHVEDA